MDGENGLLKALDSLYAMPDDYREFTVERAAALDILRCGERQLDLLVGSGLQCERAGDGLRFDRYDLFNVALGAQSGRSLPEISMRYALRWMQGGPATWTEPLDWAFEVELTCPRDGGCGTDPRWQHAQLTPETAGGGLLDWRTEPENLPVRDGWVVHEGPGPVRLTGRLRTRGEALDVVSPRLREIVADFLAHDYGWARMPEALQADDARVLAAGMAPCITASRFLEREFRAAGYEARTRRGWLLGVLDLAHSWVEVVDDDGIVKCVDIAFRKLTEYAQNPHPELIDACVGFRFNRLLPLSIPAEGVMAHHRCGDSFITPRRRMSVRKMGRE
ncbi:hypothetical protein [Streptomyces sp. NPDC059258]|uniref:hypothetical protein n=1 Tax=unclassified Streptomyces TaxID=2593676 RepID=UPI00368A6285